LRNVLESTVKRGREIAEAAAAEALIYLGVADADAPKYLTDAQRCFRVQLRAHARQLGDSLRAGVQEIRRLGEQVAYEQWHRVLFTRFLVENDLLIHPALQEPISMQDCEELAAEYNKDPWQLASEYAARMLPQIFRPNDPTQRIEMSANRKRELCDLVNELDRETFLAKDSLGWSYQFWQAKRKDEINDSGVKIGASELPAVTQRFTEHYMVEFLLHNSLGAWWVSNFPGCPLPIEMPYLRFIEREIEDGRGTKMLVRSPAAGSFGHWPKHLRDFKLLDPCCGSGHFPVFALMLLVPMRMQLEGLSARDAVDAVLRENIYALELDARCVEIAVFALALAAWTYPEAGGYRQLPAPNVACSGLPIVHREADWLKLANGDDRLREGMRTLYRTFKDAPILGSLIDPHKTLRGDLVTADFDELAPLLESALGNPSIQSNAESFEAVLAAKGLAQAAKILSQRYTLQVTNPPYLGRSRQGSELRTFCQTHYPKAKQDLANVFLERCLSAAQPGGTVQFVMPQNWLFLRSYKAQRKSLLNNAQWNLIARLGPGAFETVSGEIVQVVLLTLTHTDSMESLLISGIDASLMRSATEKARILRTGDVVTVSQSAQLENPDLRITLDAGSSGPLLEHVCTNYAGLLTGDSPRFRRNHWELPAFAQDWEPEQSTVDDSCSYSGRSGVLLWEKGHGQLYRFGRENVATLHNVDRRGEEAWGRKGVAVTQMGNLPVTLYTGQKFDTNVAVLTPKDPVHLPAVWCFCSSAEYREAVRRIDQKLNVTNATLVKVPFDLVRWQEIALERFPKGLPQPYSDEPTQWIFHGHPGSSTEPLHVAVARLLGYRWPAETDLTMELAPEARALIRRCADLMTHVVDDGVVCIPAVKGERPAAERLIRLLGDAFGALWTSGLEAKLLSDAGAPGVTLETWLRDEFFEQHCRLFHDRPFVWHIWDGQKDGFAALVNYHKLDKARLETLTYAYLGDWISQQERRVAAGLDGADVLVTAAQNLQVKLKLILAGEPPCDIFVRWKSLADQPVGWNPDLNDGVRLNIRPFLFCGDVGKKGAGILRNKPSISWSKDRGSDVASAPWFHLGPEYGEEKGARINDHHTTLAEKNEARAAKA
jgi:hypothetical protein